MWLHVHHLKMPRKFSVSRLERNGCSFGQFLFLRHVYIFPLPDADHRRLAGSLQA